MESPGKCDLCSSDTETIYRPKKSQIGLQILICKRCGFVQSQKCELNAQDSSNFEIEALSCDSDYSPIRVGKQQMTNSDIKNVESCNLDRISSFDFLDMASARGHFATWALTKTLKDVTCLEPDEYMVDTYLDNNRIRLHIGDYREFELLGQFDFIYSCHTLEHFRSPTQYLGFVHSHLNANGYLYLNVPNLAGILEVTALDDFFYDKHRVYFDPEILISILRNLGFEMVASWVDSACIRYLVRKTEKLEKINYPSDYEKNRKLILDYISSLNTSRKNLPRLVNILNAKLDPHSTKIILGCGRMLDAIISYGKLDLSQFDFLVDNYLGLATKKLYSRNLYTLDDLPAIPGDIQFLVVSRTSNAELGARISKLFPHAKVLYFTEIGSD